jgi:hypothetical protein
MVRLALLLGLVLLIQVAPIPAGADAPAVKSQESERYIEGSLALLGGVIHREATYGFDAVFALGGWNFRGALVAPMRFNRGGLRSRDWDETTDFGRIIGELGYGDGTGPVTVILEPLHGLSLGVGNLVSRYASTVDPDHWRTGLRVHLDWRPAGVDAFIDSFLDPAVMGARAVVRPFFWADDRGIFGRFEIGGSVVADLSAPSSMVPRGMDVVGLPIHDTRAVVAGSLDIRWPVLRLAQVEVTPYGAWSRVDGADGGHVGLALGAAPIKKLRFVLTGEWRWLGPGFVASWFDDLYMADRHDFDGVPKAAATDRLVQSRQGMRLGLSLDWDPYLGLWGVLDIDPFGEFSTFGAGVRAGMPDVFEVRASLYERGFRTGGQFLDPDRFVASVSGHVRVWRWIDVFATYCRDLAMSGKDPDLGRYLASDTAIAGVRFGLGWRHQQ